MQNPFRVPLHHKPYRRAVAICALFVAACYPHIAGAQIHLDASAPAQLNQNASAGLPDAPGEASSPGSGATTAQPTGHLLSNDSSLVTKNTTPSSLPEASHTQRYPLPGQSAPVLTSHDKVVMGLQGAFSPYAAVGWISAAGYEQVTGTTPYYGSDRGAFGQRLGAAAIRAISEDTLADSVLAPVFHEDPRYYRLGPTHKPFARLIYAVTRSVITRDDQGRTVPNLSQIGGNLAGSALTNAYYPAANRSASQTMETFGGSLGGTALGDAIAEFFGGMLFDHHSHRSN